MLGRKTVLLIYANPRVGIGCDTAQPHRKRRIDGKEKIGR